MHGDPFLRANRVMGNMEGFHQESKLPQFLVTLKFNYEEICIKRRGS